MKNLPNMILIGSTARNIGKTRTAVSIIEKIKSKQLVIALKITCIDEKNGKCMHGNTKCGVCSSFSGKSELLQEFSSTGNKDTCKLLKAGADRVFWLKTLRSELKESFEDFLRDIPDNAVIICESNSLRKYFKPGRFIMVTSSDQQSTKSSAQEVIDLADRIISYEADLLTKNACGKSVIIDINEYESLKAALKLMSKLTKGEKSAREKGWISIDDVEIGIKNG
ncbi:hypothetical protein Q5O14_03710 [Eubacteriaceae bacterium ES2]|nr:hypothetical protein Q5O14_03710 [Eubacteriaceae bacterium ES2]